MGTSHTSAALLSDLDPHAPRGHLYHVLDGHGLRTHGVELETAEFLHALVRAAKPDLILESGTGYGGATRYLAAALEANGFGQLVSYESNPRFFALADIPGVHCRQGSTLDHQGDRPDMVFLDSAPLDLRVAEFRRWILEPVLLVVHDTAYHPELGQIANSAGDGFTLPVPRGLWMRDQR